MAFGLATTAARALFITADAGESNGHRRRVWKPELQRLADKLDLAIHVSHGPPGTSTWTKIEHRLFSVISINWRGRPLRTYETVLNLIGNTTHRGGRVVRARLDRRKATLPTDQIVFADHTTGFARAGFGGMGIEGIEGGYLVFHRVREIKPEELSPQRGRRMTLEPHRVAAMDVEGRRGWPFVVGRPIV